MNSYNGDIKIAVAAASSTVRVLARQALENSGYKVCTAANIAELIRLLRIHNPHGLVIEEGLPNHNHFHPLNKIKRDFKVKVLLISNKSVFTSTEKITAMSAGVNDIFLNATLHPAQNLKLSLPKLLNKVHNLVQRTNIYTSEIRGKIDITPPARFICIGSSTGGTVALEEIVRTLPVDFNDVILIAQHFPAGFSLPFAKRLNGLTPLTVIQGEYGMAVNPGMVIVAPANKHMLLTVNSARPNCYQLQLKQPVAGEFNVPGINLLMRSVAITCKTKAVGIILTGMGTDGTNGVGEIESFGGITIAQDSQSSQVFGMPRSAIMSGKIKNVMSLNEIANFIACGAKPILA